MIRLHNTGRSSRKQTKSCGLGEKRLKRCLHSNSRKVEILTKTVFPEIVRSHDRGSVKNQPVSYTYCVVPTIVSREMLDYRVSPTFSLEAKRCEKVAKLGEAK
jgi:hypothetical protein